MLSILDAFGIEDRTILADKDRLTSYLALDDNPSTNDGHGKGNCSKTLVSVVVTLVGVVYSMQSRLEDLERDTRKGQERGGLRNMNLKRTSRQGGLPGNGPGKKYGGTNHVSVALGKEEGEEADDDNDDDGDDDDDDDAEEEDNKGGRDRYGVVDDDDTAYDDDSSEDDELDGDEDEDVKNDGTDDSEGDLDDDLDAVFDSVGVNDSVEHPVPVNFTYNYKPQQITNLKIPANVSAGEKSGRTISIINWTDVPLSQVAVKYNVSKSVIGPTLQVLRDFEKRNTRALQDTIKRNRAEAEQRKLLKASEVKTNVKSSEIGKQRKTNGEVKTPVSSETSRRRGRRRDIRIPSSHRVRLRLRNRRGRGAGGSRRLEELYDESSSESVYDPNYRSDEDEDEEKEHKMENKMANAIEGDIDNDSGMKEKADSKETVQLSKLENGVGKRRAEEEEPNGTPKKVKFGDVMDSEKVVEKENEDDKENPHENENEKENVSIQTTNSMPELKSQSNMKPKPKSKSKVDASTKLSNSLYSLLQSVSTSQTNDELVGSVTALPPVQEDKVVSRPAEEQEQVSSFAYALTSNGMYQCKSRGCDVKPFSQYIQLYKHKATQHPQELPS